MSISVGTIKQIEDPELASRYQMRKVRYEDLQTPVIVEERRYYDDPRLVGKSFYRFYKMTKMNKKSCWAYPCRPDGTPFPGGGSELFQRNGISRWVLEPKTPLLADISAEDKQFAELQSKLRTLFAEKPWSACSASERLRIRNAFYKMAEPLRQITTSEYGSTSSPTEKSKELYALYKELCAC